MLKELQPHYLDLVVQAVEAAGGACLLRKQSETAGVIYVTPSDTETKVDYRITFAFDHENAEVALAVKFVDGRPNITFKSSYLEGINDFFPLLLKALTANRLEHRSKVCGAPVTDHGQSTCTMLSGHKGAHRCSAADVDARRAA